MDDTHLQPFFTEDPDAYEWPCDICGKPFRPLTMFLVDRCQNCAAEMLIKVIFQEREEDDSE